MRDSMNRLDRSDVRTLARAIGAVASLAMAGCSGASTGTRPQE